VEYFISSIEKLADLSRLPFVFFGSTLFSLSFFLKKRKKKKVFQFVDSFLLS